jgi:hypothetical protein
MKLRCCRIPLDFHCSAKNKQSDLATWQYCAQRRVIHHVSLQIIHLCLCKIWQLDPLSTNLTKTKLSINRNIHLKHYIHREVCECSKLWKRREQSISTSIENWRWFVHSTRNTHSPSCQNPRRSGCEWSSSRFGIFTTWKVPLLSTTLGTDSIAGVKLTETIRLLMRLEVLATVNMSMLVFWAVTPCRLVDLYVSEKHTASVFSAEDGILCYVTLYCTFPWNISLKVKYLPYICYQTPCTLRLPEN